jgi:hypothetical protein
MSFIKKNLLAIIILLAIFILSLFLRFYNLNSIPLGFHIDEAIIADNANSVLQTGKDTNNNFFPLQTEQFGDYNPMGYAYLAVLPIKFLGLTILAARSVGAVLGGLAAIATFFLAYSVFEKKKISLLASLLVAISPWAVVMSRSTEETASTLVFVVAGFALLIFSVKKEKIFPLILSTIMLFISYFMYFTPRLFVPLLFLMFFLPIKYWYSKRKSLFTKVFFCCFLFIVTSAFLLVKTSGGSSRFNQVSIFGFPQTKLVMEEQIREDGVSKTSIPITRLFHNKPFDYSLTFLANYFQYFSADFLFIKGGLPEWFMVPGMGLIYLIELPFIVYGFYLFFKKRKSFGFVIIAWLLLAPAAASLTVDDIPNVRRAFVVVPVIEIIAAFGIVEFVKIIPQKIKKISVGILLVLFILNFFYFLHQYFIHSPIHRNWYRNEGFGEMITTIKKDYSNYDKIIVTKSLGGIYPLILFYMNYDPNKYLAGGPTKDADFTGFGKFFFVPTDCPSVNKDSRFPKTTRTIYIDNGNCPDYPGLERIKHNYIIRKDQTRVFRIVYQ